MIEERRKRYEKELHEKYLQLYHNEQCYEELMQMLEGAYQDRSAELRRLDGRREKEPNWYRNRNMLGMTMYPKLFAGGLKGVIEHLDYLSEQKITYLHLMPLLKMPHPHNDGGYAVEDFKQVDPEIGTNEELKRLTKELRKRGISLCLDVVMNHTADTHSRGRPQNPGSRRGQGTGWPAGIPPQWGRPQDRPAGRASGRHRRCTACRKGHRGTAAPWAALSG